VEKKSTLSIIRFIHLPLLLTLLFSLCIQAQEFNYSDSWGTQGYTLETEGPSGIQLNFSITRFDMQEIEIEGTMMKTVHLPGVFLPNDEGAPDLPGTSRFIAIPSGAQASFNISSSRADVFEDVEIAPAFKIPTGNDDGPLSYVKDEKIYNTNAFYPAEPVIISEPTKIRGVDVVQLGITPFQYNPVTKELVVYRDLKVDVNFSGGNGYFGEDRLRNRWFDPILNNILINHNSLPEVEFISNSDSQTEDFEYLIICPNDPAFLAWADSIKIFRTLQGIRTGVVTTTEIGGNNASIIESYINNAYNTWTIPPVAILFLGDYGTSGSTVHSPTYNSYCVSDHIYGDVNGNHMADIITARITAQNANHLQIMVGKFLGYERTPPTNPNYYNNPITAMGWQTERWFQICSESINGFWEHELNKNPVRENAIYSGTPPFSIWSSNQNTSMVVNYFGPNGVGYIPATPSHLTDWGGNATRLNNDINSGAFMLQHRDHGSVTGWGEPAYSISSMSGLNNDDLVYVFSINCLTGKFNSTSECFAEAFHRHQKGALGLIAASETSYSFVNDAYVWGMYDGMWPDFMPDYGNPGPDQILPAFGNVYGKYFLQYSNWPYNTSNKEVTYYLFHHHGDAFSTVYTEMPQNLNVIHDPVIISGQPQFYVSSDIHSLISLTLDGEIIGVGEGTGTPVGINLPFIVPGSNVTLTVTKQNYYRYTVQIPVVPASGPYVIADSCIINDASGNGNGLLDYGETPLLSLRANNVGVAQAENVTLILRSSDAFVTITDSLEFYGTIPAGGQLLLPDGYAIEVDPLVPDGHLIAFDVVGTDGATNWLSYFSLKAHSPVLAMGSNSVFDPGGNNNGCLDPGETAEVLIEIKNDGSSGAINVIGELVSVDPYITINTNTQNYGNLAGGDSEIMAFSVTADINTPTGHQAEFSFNINADMGLTASGTFTLVVGQIPALIICLDTNHNSGPVIKAALDSNLVANEIVQSIPADLSLYRSIFLCLGIYSNNHVLSSSEGQILADFLNSGGYLYMEGGDTWYYNSPTPVHPMFNINPIADGSGDLGTILGQPGTFTEGMSFTYSGDNSWIDRITHIPPAQTIFMNQSPSYGCAVAYDAGPYKTIGASFEFGGLSDGNNTKIELMQKYIEFFELAIIPVELISFNAEIQENGITLLWQTATETNNSGFDVERSSDNKTFEKMGFVEGKGTTSELQEYRFVDAGVTGKGKYYYRLRQVDYDGTESYSDVLEVDYSIIPTVFSLSQNYPNPFNPLTTIQFGIPEAVKTTLKIYDAIGSEVATIVNEVLEPGYYKYQWNGVNCASGVYFYRLQAGSFVSTKKLMLLK
jgi:hypothetical protein